mmetsp:Transcript_99382/g.212906  ORF Transcript_99382/g.212906 Transcript_99382/m.212906 type:complete len:224 (-) Transcript_99382:497-1168(-)
MQVLLCVAGRLGPVWVVGQGLLVAELRRSFGVHVPSLDHLQPLKDLRGHLRFARLSLVPIGVPLGLEVLEDLCLVAHRLRPRHAQRVCDILEGCCQLRIALHERVPAGHLSLAPLVLSGSAIGVVQRLTQWPAVDTVEGRLEDVLARGREHASCTEQRRGVRVLLRYCHIVGCVIVVDLHVIERATTEVHVDLRMVEEHLDDLTRAALRSNNQRGDLLVKFDH